MKDGKTVVLLVEDTEVGMGRFREMLPDDKFVVYRVKNHRQVMRGLEHAVRETGALVDCIVTGLFLDDGPYEGISLIAQLREMELYRSVPIIAWSRSTGEDLGKAMEAGANLTVAKYSADEYGMAQKILNLVGQKPK